VRDILDRARQRLPAVEFFDGDFMQVDLPAGSADVVTGMAVLSHVQDQAGFLARVARLLRPGGHLMLATQNPLALSRWDGVPPQDGRQIRRWVGATALRRMLSMHFEVRQLTSIVPVGHRGILKLVNSHKLNRLAGVLVGDDRVLALKERWLLGHTLMVDAVRRPDTAMPAGFPGPSKP
jgi:2-polyprenyl-3-methyl-5-hydroxy-6-metoxy-1,4-benzoquinol methylase